MSAKNKALYDSALRSVSALHSDTSVDQHETISKLRELREEIDVMIEATAQDIMAIERDGLR